MLTDRPNTFGRTTIVATPSGGMTADQKRGLEVHPFWHGHPARFSAYLDGLGGPATGSQSVRMVLYQDSSGVPAGGVAQSNIVTMAAGTTGRGAPYTAPATPLDPGQYWTVLHTGATQGIACNRGVTVDMN